MMHKKFRFICMAMLSALMINHAHALQRLESCYDQLGLEQPQPGERRILYLFIDQTMPITGAMQNSVYSLLSDWNRSGDAIKIARFSANTKGQFTELVYDAVMDVQPSEEYLYHLRDQDHDNLLSCLTRRQEQYTSSFQDAFKNVMNGINPRLPKTDLFYAMMQFSDMLAQDRAIADKTALLVTDGLENSKYTTFHKRKSMANIAPEKELLRLSSRQLITEWFNAKVYIYGLGYLEDKDVYVAPDMIEPLKEFWRLYFTAGNAQVKGLGTPALLVNSLR